jgi:xyloglucan-specific exo-beta-1,4-glucanase
VSDPLISDLAIDSVDARRIYASSIAYLSSIPLQPGAGDAGVFESRDAGSTWVQVNRGNGFQLSDYPIVRLIMDPNRPRILYAAAGAAGIFKSANGGVSWTLLRSLTGSPYVGDLAVSGRNLVALTSAGIFALHQ